MLTDEQYDAMAAFMLIAQTSEQNKGACVIDIGVIQAMMGACGSLLRTADGSKMVRTS